MTYAKILLHTLWEFAGLNKSWILKALTAVVYFFAGIHLYLISVFALTLIDVVTGVLAALKRGEPFKSRILRKGLLEKTALYLVLILTVFVLDLLTQHIFHHTSFWFSFIISFLIGTYEISSIMENLNTIKPNLPFLSGLVRIFGKLHKNTLDKLEDRVDDVVDKVTDFKTITDSKKDEPTEPSAEVK